MIDVREITIAQAQDAFRAAKFTAVELTSAFLERIATIDKSGVEINSTMALSATVLEEAAALDEHLARTGQLKGPLHGIPILVKDQADTKDIITTYGSAAAKANIPTEDATVITKLRDAGGLILGKTTMAEWAFLWVSASSATDYAYTKNPYNLLHDVGASSGGSAAAVAANLSILAVGEDTGGSIRVPSSFCNLVGLRPTPGLISRAGFCPLLKHQDTPGPMARTVRDCALMLDAMVGFDPKDGYTSHAATAAALGLPRGGSYASGLPPLDEDSSKKSKLRKAARIGVVREQFGPPSDPYCAATNAVVEAAMDRLARSSSSEASDGGGAEFEFEFVDVHIADLQHFLHFPLTYDQQSRHDINAFLATKQPHLPRDVADVVPAAADRDILTGLVKTMHHGPRDPREDPTYVDRVLDRAEFRRRVVCLMAEQRLDALTLPDVRVPPPRIADGESGRLMGEDGIFALPVNTFLASVALLPAISVPAGFTEEGLPVGMELIGMEHQEQHLLELAAGVERVLGARRAPDL